MALYLSCGPYSYGLHNDGPIELWPYILVVVHIVMALYLSCGPYSYGLHSDGPI